MNLFSLDFRVGGRSGRRQTPVRAPASEDARATGVKFATVRITARILLLATDPAGAMPKPRRAA